MIALGVFSCSAAMGYQHRILLNLVLMLTFPTAWVLAGASPDLSTSSHETVLHRPRGGGQMVTSTVESLFCQTWAVCSIEDNEPQLLTYGQGPKFHGIQRRASSRTDAG